MILKTDAYFLEKYWRYFGDGLFYITNGSKVSCVDTIDSINPTPPLIIVRKR